MGCKVSEDKVDRHRSNMSVIFIHLRSGMEYSMWHKIYKNIYCYDLRHLCEDIFFKSGLSIVITLNLTSRTARMHLIKRDKGKKNMISTDVWVDISFVTMNDSRFSWCIFDILQSDRKRIVAWVVMWTRIKVVYYKRENHKELWRVSEWERV